MLLMLLGPLGPLGPLVPLGPPGPLPPQLVLEWMLLMPGTPPPGQILRRNSTWPWSKTLDRRRSLKDHY
jgi:hypothetical protein